MPNNNAYLARLQSKKNAEMSYTRKFTIQWCEDAAVLAANDVFQRRGDKIAEFRESFCQWAYKIASTTLEDARDDKSIDYTKGTIDKMLLDVLGEEHFVPWEKRYDVWSKGDGH